jgi:hypothetical protein
MTGDLDAGTWARLLGAICAQAIHDHQTGWQEPGFPDATRFLWDAGLLHADGTIGRPSTDTPPRPFPQHLRPARVLQRQRRRLP